MKHRYQSRTGTLYPCINHNILMSKKKEKIVFQKPFYTKKELIQEIEKHV